jgi:hypothetical protein
MGIAIRERKLKKNAQSCLFMSAGLALPDLVDTADISCADVPGVGVDGPGSSSA